MSDTPARANTAPTYHDKIYRSVSAVVSGVFLLALLLWLSIDAMVTGSGSAPVLAASVLVLGVPLIVAFTLWPQVRAGENRLLVRNPFRTVETRWDGVESLVSALSVELRAGGHKFVIWALPVSLRQRKKANRRSMIAAGDRGTISNTPRPSMFGSFGGGSTQDDSGPTQAMADKAVAELNERVEKYRQQLPADAGTPEVKVTWTWWLIAPIVAGALAGIITLAVG
ncbi:PH domain-containing protein [Streptacidiphilus jiangxiensis]|uniref:PH domain-containing protein n=1 Tax=Streptacidiphilus jiangxiensis TaxID=235985 RepID=A0A1H7MG48_STRJI|nr:PH domain-containing protein [Streptacidiphilus jiangxiensis]SEL09665.1 PH domain-containing protein [Streptacidiphilus jiangxiensis]